jgi:hypothetical protein
MRKDLTNKAFIFDVIFSLTSGPMSFKEFMELDIEYSMSVIEKMFILNSKQKQILRSTRSRNYA